MKYKKSPLRQTATPGMTPDAEFFVFFVSFSFGSKNHSKGKSHFYLMGLSNRNII
jgi:hypothetical protein